ncbi:MAG: PAS domain S-box protein [Pseudomonadota bacterium]
MDKQPIKKLLRASLDLFDACQTGILYGTNQTKIRYLPTAAWDRGVMDAFDGRGPKGLLLKLLGTYIVTARKMSPVLFYQKEPGGQLKETSGVIAYVLRTCADYYKNGISIIICPETRKASQNKKENYFEVPFYVYDGHCIKQSSEKIRADARIVRYFKSQNSIYVYLPDYGILVINTANLSLFQQRNGIFLQEKQLLDRLNQLNEMVYTASLENLSLLRGKNSAQLLWHKEKHLQKISRELIDNEKNYRNLYQTAPIAYISMDIKGVILNCNQMAQYLFGYDAQDLIGRNVDSFLFKKDQRDTIAADIQSTLLKGKVVNHMELQMASKDGKVLWVSLSIDAVRDRHGMIIELRAAIMDITERKNLETQLFQSQKMEAIGRLSSGIAHDFNNILSPISVYGEMLLMNTPKENPHYGYLSVIHECASQAKQMVSQMLDFGKQTEPVLNPIHLSNAATESMQMAGFGFGDHPVAVLNDCIRKGPEKILLLDDDQKVLDMQAYLFETLGYTVTCFLEPIKALEYFKIHPRAFDLVISDLTMAQMTGIELANHMARIRPDLPVIFCSGQEGVMQKTRVECPSFKGFLKKPISIKAVSDVLTRVLGRAS